MARILLVDDDPDFVEIIKTVLESEGYEVTSASDGTQAMRQMRHQRPDLVLLDVMMSYVLDGLEVSHEMEQDPVLSQIPVIMVSSIAGSPYAGMFPTDEYIPIDAWLSKPINPPDLLRVVAKHVPAAA
jgi:CheY-like chemotaxis protein